MREWKADVKRPNTDNNKIIMLSTSYASSQWFEKGKEDRNNPIQNSKHVEQNSALVGLYKCIQGLHYLYMRAGLEGTASLRVAIKRTCELIPSLTLKATLYVFVCPPVISINLCLTASFPVELHSCHPVWHLHSPRKLLAHLSGHIKKCDSH